MADEATEGAVKVRRGLASFWLSVLLIGGSLLPGQVVAQDNPLAQCEQGEQLFLEGRAAEAKPLLEAGIAGFAEFGITDLDALGTCALTLGVLYYNTGNGTLALDALDLALRIFQTTGDRFSEGLAFLSIGQVYAVQQRYTDALSYYERALVAMREVGGRAGEGRALYLIGRAYVGQGRNAEALEVQLQALAIAREVDDRASEGQALGGIGEVYANQQRYTEALEAIQQALVIQREIGDRADEGILLEAMAAVYETQGHYAQALTACRQALAIAMEVGDQPGQESALSCLGAANYNLAHYSEALDYFAQALAIQRLIGRRISEATTLVDIGMVYYVQGRYAQALEAYEQALGIQREMGQRDAEGATLGNIGKVYASQGRTLEALDMCQQALVIARETGDRLNEGRTLHSVGMVFGHLGRYAEALDLHQQALAISREVGDRGGEGMVLNSIAVTYKEQGRFDEALEYYRQSLGITQETGNGTDEARTLNNMGVAYERLGRYAEALDCYQQALAIMRDMDNPAVEASTLNNIGAFLKGQGRNAEALEQYQQALEIARELGDRVKEGLILSNIGVIRVSQTRHTEAIGILQEALAIQQEVNDRSGEAITLYNIAFSYHEAGQPLQAAVYYEAAMDAFESVREAAGDEAARAGFIAQHADVFNRAIRFYHEQKQDAEAFRTDERGRARAFLDSLATGYVELSDAATAELLAREESAYVTRQAAQDALSRARGAQPPDAALVADLETQLAAAEQEHADAAAAIQARGDQLAALVPGRGGVLELSEVQALLDEQTTLVSYHVLGDAGSLAFIITSKDFKVIELPDATPSQLRTAIADLSQWLQDNPENLHPLRLRELYTWLVAPLLDHLHTPRVGIIPHQLLHYVPFAALTDSETHFGQRYVLFTLPSASSLRFIQQNAAEPDGTGVLIYGNPTSDVPDLKPLLYAEQEAKNIASHLETSAFLRKDATEAQLRSGAGGARILHLSAHGGYNNANPLYSTVYLAPGDGQDGRLETHEVYSLDLKGNEVVVLSACETNVGELSAGDEVIGLTRAFFFAGAPTVISSLWAVDDAATGVLMTAFYRHWLQDGTSKAQALQAAQTDVRNDPRWGSPFFWAGFVLNGDPGKSEMSQKATALPMPESATPHPASQADQTSGTRLPIILLVVGGLALVAVAAIWLLRRRTEC